MACEKIKEIDNYQIHFQSYEKWFGSLTKSWRQNIRTAYNRLHATGFDCQIIKYTNKDLMKKNQFDRFINLYCDRQRKHYKRQGLKNALIYKYYHYVSCTKKSNYSTIYALFFNGELSAIAWGYIKNKEFFVPRLAINETFKWYSPGIILINEIIKKGEIEVLNLTRGNETYKQNLGGELYKTYCFEQRER